MLNQALIKAREMRGETTYQVAEAVGIDQSHLSRVENGKKQASPDLANRLAKHFGNAVTRDQILYPEDYADMPRKQIAQQLQKAS